jgi:hypothetical protein
MTLLLAHFVTLAFLSQGTARRLVRPVADRIIAAVLLFWANLVATSLALSWLGHLNQPSWFFRSSIVLGLVTFLVVRRLALPPPEPAPASKANRNPWLIAGVVITLLPLVAANLAIAFTYEPNNYDSMTYHLPRVMYYLGHNSLAHFETADFRQVYYPFNFNLLQLFCLVYDAPVQSLTFLNVAMWALAGVAVFRVARLGGCSFDASLLAGWLTVTSTEVLAQGTSTILDLPSATALICAVVFALRWRESLRTSDALLAAIAASMSAGTKLTVAFFGPSLALLLAVFVYQAWRNGTLRGFLAGARAWVIPALLAGFLCAPFVLYNLKATGEMMTHRMDFTLNKPFRLGCALQTAQGYLVQIFCEPLGRFSFDLDWINTLNTWFTQHVFTHWNEAYAFSALYTIPPDLNEDHVFFGFAGPLFLVSAALCLWHDRRLQRPVTWVALAGLGWFVTYFATNKWSLYNQRYFVPPMVLLAPCAAVVWDAGRGRIRRLIFHTVAATGLWFSLYYVVWNNIRPTPLPWADVVAPKILSDLPAALTDRLAAQSRIHVFSYGTNERIYPLMHLAKNQRFTSGSKVDPQSYNLLSFWGATRNAIYSNLAYFAAYTIVSVPEKPTAGVEFLGTVLGAGDAFDYLGLKPNADDTASSATDRNVALLVDYNADTNDPVRLNGARVRAFGLNPRDHAELRLNAEMADGTMTMLAKLTDSDWKWIAMKGPFKRLVLAVADSVTGRELGHGEMPFTVKRSESDAPPPLHAGTLFSAEVIADGVPPTLAVAGLAGLEGPYIQWDLPRFRWAKQRSVQLIIPATPQLKKIRLTFSVRLQVRPSGGVEVLHNHKVLQHFRLEARDEWRTETLEFAADAGENLLELRDQPNAPEPDWLAYLDQNPDVKKYVLSRKEITPEEGARLHYESRGRAERRPLPLLNDPAIPPAAADDLYFVYRTLRVEGLSEP